MLMLNNLVSMLLKYRCYSHPSSSITVEGSSSSWSSMEDKNMAFVSYLQTSMFTLIIQGINSGLNSGVGFTSRIVKVHLTLSLTP